LNGSDNGFRKRKEKEKRKKEENEKGLLSPPGGTCQAEPIKILPMGWRFVSANPKGGGLDKGSAGANCSLFLFF
jgi:hypothetical protein